MLDEILKANLAFVSGKPASPKGEPFTGPVKGLAIVSCMDARLAGMLPEALGCGPRDAVLIRNAGNTITPTDDSILRSVAAAAYIQGIRHVAVVGHTDCRMAGDTRTFIDGMGRAGIPRSAFGTRDLREWLGLFGNVEANVRAVLDVLRQSPLLPAGLDLYGLIVDSDTGRLRVLQQEKTAGPAMTAATASAGPVRAGDSTPTARPPVQAPAIRVPEPFVPKAARIPPPPPILAPPLPRVAVPGAAAKAPPKTITAAPPGGGADKPVPMDLRAAEEFFWKREQERLRTKRRLK